MTIPSDWWYEDKSTLSEGVGTHFPGPEQRDWLPDYHPFGGQEAVASAAGYPPGTPLNTYAGPGLVDDSVEGPDRSHYYSGYWAGVQAAQYGFGGNSYGNLKPWPLGPHDYDSPFVYPFRRREPLIIKALTTVTPHGWPRGYLPRNRPYNPMDPMSPFVPWDEPWAHPPWVQPEEWPQIVDPYISASGSALQRVNPELNYDEQAPGNFIIDTIERLIFDPIRPMTDADSAFIGHPDITPGTGGSSTTPANIPSNIFPGDINSMGGLPGDFGGPRTHFGDGIIDSTGFFLDQ